MITSHHIYIAKKAIFTALAVWLAAYLFVVLLTYSPNDPSWSHISSDMGNISNVGGAVGAWISDILYTMLGWSAWWLIVFLAYEALSLWWQREQNFGVLRVIGYLFLLLASSALIEITPQLLTAESNGLTHGGILGFELANRLAGLLTTAGATVFLLLFAFITATFAFDIRWLNAVHSIINLSWLGSGVKREPRRSMMDEALNQQVTEGNEHGGAGTEDSSEYDTEITDNEVPVNEAPVTTFGQLPLELPEGSGRPIAEEYGTSVHTHHNETNTTLLDDFLIQSGISDSVIDLQQQEAEAEAARQNQEALTTPLQDVNLQETVNLVTEQDSFEQNLLEQEGISQAPTSKISRQGSDKKEQGFTWRDAHPLDSSSINSSTTVESFDTLSTDRNADMISNEDTFDSLNRQNSEQDNKQNNKQDNRQSSRVTSDPIDLTPTNTPPANPKEAPKVAEYAEDKPSNMTSSTASTTRIAPTIKFATPEDGSGNQIEDMVPDTDDDTDFVQPVTLPDIHDDRAFALKSRSRQTAKYRSSLTPIPELSLLDKPDPDRRPSYNQAELKQLSELLEIKLQDFNVKAEVVNAIPGPVVTRFEVELAPGVKASKVTGISRDLARSLSMASLRVVEVIPGKPYIGIEVPNKKREMVRLIELLHTEKYKDPKAQISMAMGKDIGGKPIITDLARAPHMLVAGTTGSGKSVLVNSMLLSMLLKYTPNELRLILIDPKQLELANYNDIPHLLTPVVTDMNEAASSLSWCVAEMERRYQLMSLLKVRKLGEFNKKVIAAEKAGRPMIDPLWRPNDSVSIDQAPKLKTLPMIVIVADEFADMIMQVGKQAEELITRLAQKSRAAGIHLMLATQRPSVDVITGLIKANIPVRAALRVNSKVDSRTILDAGGAEDMLGNGDMLFLGPGQIEPDRVHGAYVSDEEVNRVCDAWRERGAPDYIDNMASNFELSSPSGGSGNTSGEDDELYDQAVAFIMETRKVSASSIQRKFSIGYNRAARIVDSMEEAGLVSSMGKSGKRELLM